MDLTKIKKPFGLLDPETQAALRAHGGPYEVFAVSNGLGWKSGMFGNDMDQFAALVWRVKPAPLTKPSIEWSHVAPEYKWLADWRSGEGFLFTCKPKVSNSWQWGGCDGKLGRVSAFASYTPGTCDWRDSLVERPA
jgi:hypothetical protein